MCLFGMSFVANALDANDYYSLVALCSTLFFLTLVACIGAWIGSFVIPAIMRGMNIIAGILLIGLGTESLLKVWKVRKSI